MLFSIIPKSMSFNPLHAKFFIWNIKNVSTIGVSIINSFSLFHCFPCFSEASQHCLLIIYLEASQHWLPIIYHVHIW